MIWEILIVIFSGRLLIWYHMTADIFLPRWIRNLILNWSRSTNTVVFSVLNSMKSGHKKKIKLQFAVWEIFMNWILESALKFLWLMFKQLQTKMYLKIDIYRSNTISNIALLKVNFVNLSIYNFLYSFLLKLCPVQTTYWYPN